MATPESKTKRTVKNLLNKLSADRPFDSIYHHWPVQTGFGAPTLDCVGCCNGHFFSIETKAPGGKLTARQQHTIEEMRASGAKVFVIGEQETQGGLFPYSGLEELETWLRGL